MNKNKGFIGIGLLVAIILGIVVVGGGAYYFGTKKNTKVVENTSVTNPIEENNSHEVPAGPYGTEADYVAPKPINSAEESSTESFKNQPGEIKGIKDIGRGQYEITVDLLTPNPKWIPGGNEKIFLNQSSKIRSLYMDLSAKTYNCGEGADGNPTTADVPENNSIFINKINNSNYKNRYFDISGTNITAIYEQCLP